MQHNLSPRFAIIAIILTWALWSLSFSWKYHNMTPEKKEILRPYNFKGQDKYCIITELKNTNSSIYQKLNLYGVPSISFGKENGRWQAVSCATYSFKKNNDLFQKILKDKMIVENIDPDKSDEFEKDLSIKESERYFYRDKDGEPFWYTFKIESVHFNNSKQLFIQANELIIDQLEFVKRPIIGGSLTRLESFPNRANTSNIIYYSISRPIKRHRKSSFYVLLDLSPKTKTESAAGIFL